MKRVPAVAVSSREGFGALHGLPPLWLLGLRVTSRFLCPSNYLMKGGAKGTNLLMLGNKSLRLSQPSLKDQGAAFALASACSCELAGPKHVTGLSSAPPFARAAFLRQFTLQKRLLLLIVLSPLSIVTKFIGACGDSPVGQFCGG